MLLFTQKGRQLDQIPPTKAALLQHVRRAVYQAVHCWGQMLIPTPELHHQTNGDGSKVAQAAGNQDGRPCLRPPMHVENFFDVAARKAAEDTASVSRLPSSALLSAIVVDNVDLNDFIHLRL